MKTVWYFMTMILMLSILASFASMSSPTSAFATNLPPKWDLPTSEFAVENGQFSLSLDKAFFDADGDPLSFSVSPSEGISAGVYGSELVILTESSGYVTISVSDGNNIVSQKIFVYN